MSPTNKGIVSIVLALLGLFSAVWVDMLNIKPILLVTAMIPLVISIIAIYLGVEARKGNARVLGIAGLFLGIIGALSHILKIISFIR